MKIIISPAKKMRENSDFFDTTKAQFLDRAQILCEHIRSLSYEDAQKMWKCNDEIATLNVERFADMDPQKANSPAILSYEGLQYQHIAAHVMSADALLYLGEHLRILSGLYGILRPFDAVVPYRLEMQSKLKVKGYKDLYDFWGKSIYESLIDEECLIDEKSLIINLASKEYSQVIQRHLNKGDVFITVDFVQIIEGRAKQKGTLAKMARGEMLRFLAENQIRDLEEMKKFNALGFRYCEELSSDESMVFVQRHP